MKTLTITRMFVSRLTVSTKLLKICLSNRLIDDENFKRFEKGCPVTIFFVYIPLATVTSSTVTSSKLNVENFTKAHYVDETHSYHFLKIEVIKSKNFMKTMINHRKLCKTMSKYIIKRLLHLYGNILC